MNTPSSSPNQAARQWGPSCVYCTYFDRNYLLQGLALYLSLAAVSEKFELWMLCLDDDSARIVAELKLPFTQYVTVTDLLAASPSLSVAKSKRPTVEFYYACTPWLVAHVAKSRPQADRVIYLDADMFYFTDPALLQDESEQSNVEIVPHASGDEQIEREHGRYNVCYVGFAQTAEAKRCLLWWEDSVLRSTALGNGTWGDQKYLDEFPERFSGVRVLDDPCAALAPWNLAHHHVSTVDGRVAVDGRPLVAYHFARFLLVLRSVFVPIRRGWIPRSVLLLIYRPYMGAIRSALDLATSVDPTYRPGYTSHNVRGLLLGMLAGRAFYEGRFGLHRLGFYIPTSRAELQGMRSS